MQKLVIAALAPAAPPERRSRDRAIALRLAGASFLFFLLFHHGHFKGSDEVGFLQVTRSIFQHGTLAVPRIVHTEVGADGRYYSHFSVGQSVTALPFYALGVLAEATLPEAALRSLRGPHNVTANERFGGETEIFTTALHAPFVSAVLVALFFLFQRALGVSLRTAVVCSLLLASTTYVTLMSTYFLRHTSESITLIGALYFYERWKREGARRDLWWGSALASATLIVRLPAAVGGLAIAGYLVWCCWERGGRRWDAAVLRGALAPVAVPLLAVVAVSSAIDYARWGVPWNLPQFQTGSLLSTPLYVSGYAFLFSPGMSVFVYSPLLALAPWSFPVLWRRRRAEAAAFLGLALCFFLAFSSFAGWTGLWSAPGPRYQLISVPLFLLPLGLWLDERRSRLRVALVAALAALGAWVQLVLMTVHWGGLIAYMRWKQAQPKWSFLFLPEESPLAGASRLFLDWRFRDNWLLRLARGWVGGEPPHPVAAAVVLAVWTLLFALAARALWRRVRAEEVAGRGAPGRGTL